MANTPAQPKIYHITHLRNLPQIVDAGRLWSDAKRIALGLPCNVVGMSHIKRRRLEEIEVSCHPGTHVGDYVPFYFCPRSIMLYILHRGNHPDLSYDGGQQPIVHLQADFHATVKWADENGIRWAFSDRNAGGRVARFYNRVVDLDKVDWAAVAAIDFRDMVVKEGKQAEFLAFDAFPWSLIGKVGVLDGAAKQQVDSTLRGAAHVPLVSVEPGWYY